MIDPMRDVVDAIKSQPTIDTERLGNVISQSISEAMNGLSDAIKSQSPTVAHITENRVYETMESGKFPDFPSAKGSPKLDLIKDWLTKNPDKASQPNRQIADLIGGVSHALVGKAKKDLGI